MGNCDVKRILGEKEHVWQQGIIMEDSSALALHVPLAIGNIEGNGVGAVDMADGTVAMRHQGQLRKGKGIVCAQSEVKLIDGTVADIGSKSYTIPAVPSIAFQMLVVAVYWQMAAGGNGQHRCHHCRQHQSDGNPFL